MLNYLRAEAYKVTRRKYIPGFLLSIFLGQGVLIGGMLWANRDGFGHVDFGGAAMMLPMLLMMGIYFSVIINDMVFSEQYKHNTMKNEVAYGLPRTRIYFGKLISALLLGLTLLVLVAGVYLLACWVAFPKGTQEETAFVWSMLGRSILTALPLFMGSLAVAVACCFLVSNATAGAFLTVGIIAGPAIAGKILYLTQGNPIWLKLQAIGLDGPFSRLYSLQDSWALCGEAWLIGMGWFLVATVVGLAFFQNREIQ